MATVELTFSALPAHVRTARLIATAVARRAGVSEDLLDEVRLAVGEACSRAVEAHRLHCPDEPIRIELRDDSGRFEVTVTDVAPSEEADRAEIAGRRRRSATGTSSPACFPTCPDSALRSSPDSPTTSRSIPSAKGMRVRMSWPAANGLPSYDLTGPPGRPLAGARTRPEDQACLTPRDGLAGGFHVPRPSGPEPVPVPWTSLRVRGGRSGRRQIGPPSGIRATSACGSPTRTGAVG